MKEKVAWSIYKAIYDRGISDLKDVDDLPSQLRRDFKRIASIGSTEWKILAERVSTDGTLKRAYGIPGGHAIESVLMPYDRGVTACISSQVGCAMGCVFCATGQMGFKRQLTSDEIFEQAARYSSLCKQKNKRLSSVVFLGMGEPLANYDNVVTAVHRINTDLGIGMRHITLSTVGLVPAILRLAEEKLQITLAISLHNTDDDKRDKLLPVNLQYPIKSLMTAARYYQDTTTRRVSFEWTLIEGENDDEESARSLGELITEYIPGAHVNLIPLNPTKGYAGGPSQQKTIDRFVTMLGKYNIMATVRVRRGIDIDAGCGQLAERSLAEYEVDQIEVDELADA